MSETPRTDEEHAQLGRWLVDFSQRPSVIIDLVSSDFARGLERELAAKSAEVERLRAALHSLAAVARRYLPDYDEHPEIQKADEALQEPQP